VRLLAPEALPFHEVEHRSLSVSVAAVAVARPAASSRGCSGVGGGILFVPAAVLLLGLRQLDAGATSLLAMLPASYVGAWRQSRYGNLNLHASLVIGAASVGGVEAGIAIAERLPEAALRRIFGVFLVVTAAQLAWRAARSR